MVLYNLKSIHKERKDLFKSKKKSSHLNTNAFSYASYLKEKKKFSFIYGKLPLKWFIHYCLNSRNSPGKITNNLLLSLERRLDIFLYRIRFCRSIKSSRQLINHKKIVVNGLQMTSPSYSIKPGDIIQMKDKINPIIYSRISIIKNNLKKNKLKNKYSIRRRFPRKKTKGYPFNQFRSLSCEINYSLSTVIFLYSPQKLYSSYILQPTLFERSFRRTIKK